MTRRTLPPLEVGQAYEARDFEKFEYFRDALRAEGAILRLHLKNGTTIDLLASDSTVRPLLFALCDAFGTEGVRHLKERGWVD